MPAEPLPASPDDLDLLDPEPPRIWPALVAPFVALAGISGLQIGIGAAAVMILAVQGIPLSEAASRMATYPWFGLLILAAAQAGFALTALLGGCLSPVPIKERLGWLPMRGPWTLYLTSVIGVWFPLWISLALAAGLSRLMPDERPYDPPAVTLTPGWYAALVALVALGPGFCEELLFRGYIQTRLLQRWRPWMAILVTTSLFALVHLAPARILVAFPLGLWFGIVAWRTGSIWPGIISHAFVNGTLNLYLMLVHFNQTPEATQTAVEVSAVTAGLICFVIACVQLWKMGPPPAPGLAASESLAPAGE